MGELDVINPANLDAVSGGSTNAAPVPAQPNPASLGGANPSAPVPADIPGNHSKLFGMLAGLGVALSATGKALATHGREGGAQDVANYQAQQQELLLRGQQEKRAEKQEKRAAQEAVDVHEMRGAQTALIQIQTQNMLTKLPDEVTELHARAMNEMTMMYEKAGFAPQVALAMAEGQTSHEFMGQVLQNSQGRIGQNSYLPQYTGSYGSGQGKVNIGSRSSLGQVQLDKSMIAPTLSSMSDMIDHAEKMGADPKVVSQARAMLQPLKNMPEGSKVNGAQYQDLYMMVENRLVSQMAQKSKEVAFGKEQADAAKAAQEAKTQPEKDRLEMQGKKLANQKTRLDIQKTDIELAQLKEMSPNVDPNLVGDAYLAKLPPGLQQTVKAIGEGRMELSARMLQTDRGQRLAEVINRAIPGFDASKAPAYFAARKDFTSGKAAQGMNSLNTALGHVGQLYSITTTSAVMPGISDVARSLGMTNAKFFEYKKNLVGEEIQHAWTQGALTDMDKRAADDMLKEWTPKNARQGERALTELLTSKLDSFTHQWQTAKPSPAIPDFPVISPENINVIKQITGKDVQNPGAASAKGSDFFGRFGGSALNTGSQ